MILYTSSICSTPNTEQVDGILMYFH